MRGFEEVQGFSSCPTLLEKVIVSLQAECPSPTGDAEGCGGRCSRTCARTIMLAEPRGPSLFPQRSTFNLRSQFYLGDISQRVELTTNFSFEVTAHRVRIKKNSPSPFSQLYVLVLLVRTTFSGSQALGLLCSIFRMNSAGFSSPAAVSATRWPGSPIFITT